MIWFGDGGVLQCGYCDGGVMLSIDDDGVFCCFLFFKANDVDGDGILWSSKFLVLCYTAMDLL